jgi:hypothetical protein
MTNRVDNFNRADTTNAIGTPSDAGSAWVQVSGAWGITSNTAYCSSTAGQNICVLDSTSSNTTVQATMTGTFTGGGDVGLILREADDNNYILCKIAQTTVQIFKKVAGTYTSIAGPNAYTYVAGDVYSASVDASNNFVFKVNGVSKATATDAAGSSNTKHGIRSNANNAMRFDTFSITDIVAATVPDAPTIGTATAGNTQASVAFTAPVSDGGSVITGYTAISTPGSITASGASSPLTVTGLTNGVAYTFTVHATNAIGNSVESAASNSVTPFTSVPVITNNLMRRSS